VALLAVLVFALCARPAEALEVGMGDQKAAMFGDSRLRALGLRHARLVVPWDVSSSPAPAQAAAGAWLNAARALGMQPHVAFGVSPRSRGYLPTVGEYTAAVAAFRVQYPWITDYATWNEANFESQPTARNPRRAAEFFDALSGLCPTCRIVAGDVLDQANMTPWLREFVAAARTPPRIWGLHNYHEVNRADWRIGLAELLAVVPGEVWITETGGLVRIVTADRRTTWPYDEARAAAATNKVFALARSDARVTRLYFYHWNAVAGVGWDSGLIGPKGEPRLALQALRDQLALLAPAVVAPKPRARRCRKVIRRVRGKRVTRYVCPCRTKARPLSKRQIRRLTSKQEKRLMDKRRRAARACRLRAARRAAARRAAAAKKLAKRA